MRPISRNLVIIIGIIIIIAALASLYFFNQEHPDVSAAEPDYTMTATELYSEYETDEEAADAKYEGKIIMVSGRINSVETSQDGTSITITLMDEDQFAGVICSFPHPTEEALNLQPGAEVTVKGICSGMLMDVLMKNCVLASG